VSAFPIATVTLNPALDEAIAIDALAMGEANRCAFDALDPGGKGINASRVIHRLGRATVAYGFAGGVTGEWLRARLKSEGLCFDLDEVEDLTRINIMLYERASGRRTRIYLPGPHVNEGRLARLRAKLEAGAPGSLIVLGGSMPPGVPESTYRDFVLALKRRGMRAIVDASGGCLAAVLSARPLLVKPNVEEAEALLHRRLRNDDEMLAAALEIRDLGPEYVVISQGENGAIGVGPDGAFKAIPPKIAARSTVGSGDSMIGGLAIAFNENASFAEGLRLGTAAGAATATVPGTHLCTSEKVAALSTAVCVNSIFTPRSQAVANM
jgi:1-phosphofructokinase family hexose kinase